MRRTSHFLAATFATVLLLQFAQPASCVVLPHPRGAYVDTAIGGTTVASRPELAGLVLEDKLIDYDFSDGTNIVRGQVQNRVVRSKLDGTLDFYWAIRPDPMSTGGVEAFRVGGFGDFTLDADWRIDGLGSVHPTLARNFGNGSVNFLFHDDAVETKMSHFFFLDTKATHYLSAGEYDLLCAKSDCISSLYTAFVPVDLDCNGDGVISMEDLNCACGSDLAGMTDAVLEELGTVAGDLDGDGTVGFADFLRLSKSFGEAGEYTDGDFDCDGVVNFSDFLVLAQHFGEGGAATRAHAVPEPSSLTLVGLLGIACLVTRRRRVTTV